MSVLLHRHVQDRNVSRLGAWAFRVAGKAIATSAQTVLSDEEARRRKRVGSWKCTGGSLSLQDMELWRWMRRAYFLYEKRCDQYEVQDHHRC